MMKFVRLIPLLVTPMILLASCGPVPTPSPAPATQSPATEAPTTVSTPTLPPTTAPIVVTPTFAAPLTPSGPTAASTLSVADQLSQIDAILKQSIGASIAYNKPETMKLDETTTIQLLLNPSVSPEALGTQVTASGQVTTASIQITPRMKALLISDDRNAFAIQPLHDNPEQLVSGTETTQWTWRVTARKSGTQRLTLTLYRLVQYQGEDYWREIESYQANIDVQVTLAQRLSSLDWKWIAGILVTALLIPAFWRWMDYRKKNARRAGTRKR